MNGPARWRRGAALIVLFVAGLASLATEPGPRYPEGSLDLQLKISAANPVAARRVVVEVPAGAEIDQAIIEAAPGYDESFNESIVSLSIVPDDPLEPSLKAKPQMFDFLDSVNQDFTAFCRDGCTRSYTVVVRSQSIFDIDAHVSLYAFATAKSNTATTPKVKLSLADDQPGDGVGEMSTNTAIALESDLFGSGSWHGTITIPAAAHDATAGRAFGSLWVFGVPTFEGDDAGADVWIAVNGDSRFGQRWVHDSTRYPIQREWLSACTPGADCSVPIDVELRWNPVTFLGIDYLIKPGHVHADLALEARLEFIGRSDVPPGATLVIAPR